MLGWVFHNWRGAAITQLGDLIPLSISKSHDDDTYCRFSVGTLIRDESEMFLLRELVGSLHKQCVPQVTVFGYEMPYWVLEEIGVWRGAKYQDLEMALVGIKTSGHNEFVKTLVASGEVRKRLIDKLAEESEAFAFIELGIEVKSVQKLFSNEGCVEAQNVVVCNQSNASLRIKSMRLASWKGLGVRQVPEFKNHQQSHKGRCQIKIRTDYLKYPEMLGMSPHSFYLDEKHRQAWEDSKLTKVALLVPTKSSPGTRLSDSPLLELFIPSLLHSLTQQDLNRFTVAIYLGFDHGDIHYENQEMLKELRRTLGASQVIIKLHRLPNTRWLTWIWNMLFSMALADGAEYFYQLGDDVSFASQGWLTAFVDALKEQHDVGVIAPNDQMWDCSLYTNSFTSRLHQSIFGTYFPLSIRDWFSDNWITHVYPEAQRRCFLEHKIVNRRDSSRYVACSADEWKQRVKMDQDRFSRWILGEE